MPTSLSSTILPIQPSSTTPSCAASPVTENGKTSPSPGRGGPVSSIGWNRYLILWAGSFPPASRAPSRLRQVTSWPHAYKRWVHLHNCWYWANVYFQLYLGRLS